MRLGSDDYTRRDSTPPSKSAVNGVGRWTYLGIGGVLTVGFAAGSWTESVLWGSLVSVSVLVGWVMLEIRSQRRKERAARARLLEVER